MNQLEIVHKKSTSKTNQITEQVETVENKREGKGRILATSRRVYRIQNSDTFYVESENSNNIYYFVRFNPSVFEWCSCPDNSMRSIKCKHIFCIEYAIRLATVKDVEKLPKESKRDNNSIVSKLYRDDLYDF